MVDPLGPMHICVSLVGPSVYTATIDKSSNLHEYEYETTKKYVGPTELLKVPLPAPQQVGALKTPSSTLGDVGSLLISKDDR